MESCRFANGGKVQRKTQKRVVRLFLGTMAFLNIRRSVTMQW